MGGNSQCSWHDGKRDANLANHGYDFADIEEVFDGRFCVTRLDARKEYGETRYNMLVDFKGRVLNITFNPRVGRFHLISVRPARKELSTMQRSHRPEKRAAGRTDWARVDDFTDDDIERMAADDKDNPATTGDDWIDAVVGPPPVKTTVNAKFDRDVVEWFKSQGRGYQTRMNAVLRSYMQAKNKAG